MLWVYDIVTNSKDEIVAMLFHTMDHVECVGDGMEKEHTLLDEGLHVSCSMVFNTLEEAKQAAWHLRDRFHKSLD